MAIVKLINASTLRKLFTLPAPFAVIDPRSPGLFARGHLLAASNLPLDRLELIGPKRLVDRDAGIVLCDDGDGCAEQAAITLSDLGYHNLMMLGGGNAAWVMDGGALFSGVNVPGKAFGEFVEHHHATPSISAADLADRLNRGEPTLVLDSRTPAEHMEACIPGAVGCPGAELALCAGDALDNLSSETIVVVHCAGRTRSIIGAQTLTECKLGPSVFSLENGTLAWMFEGLSLETDNQQFLASPSDEGLNEARQHARYLEETHGILRLAQSSLEDKAWRTAYRYDVRRETEYANGHLPGFQQVSGGQLVQNVDNYLVIRNHPVILADDDGVRASVTASWLARMGYQKICVTTLDQDSLPTLHLEVAPETSPPGLTTLDDVRQNLDRFTIADVRSSSSYYLGHPAGAWYLNRFHLQKGLRRMGHDPILVIHDDSAHAALLMKDLECCGRQALLLEGGYETWKQAGLPVTSGPEYLASPPDDEFPNPDTFSDPLVQWREAKNYLAWEIDLLDRIPGDPAAPYAEILARAISI